MIRHIDDAANRLSHIVRDMVDVSMLDSHALRLRERVVDINQVIVQALKEIEYFFTMRHQSHELRLAEHLPPIKCDPDRLVQVITNIVVNSIKFTPDGGRITVETRLSYRLKYMGERDEEETDDWRRIGSAPAPYVEILINDTGIGIDDADQVRVFEKFYEVGIIEEHSTGKVAFKGKGTGLGLTIVKGIVEMHGGEVWVESPGCDPDHFPGSTFHILLPIPSES